MLQAAEIGKLVNAIEIFSYLLIMSNCVLQSNLHTKLRKKTLAFLGSIVWQLMAYSVFVGVVNKFLSEPNNNMQGLICVSIVGVFLVINFGRLLEEFLRQNDTEQPAREDINLL